MDQIHRIRELFYQQDMNISEIASVTGFNWKTVQKYVDIINTNREFSHWVNILYDPKITTALIGRLTHHVELILFPGMNNRLRESSIHEALTKINQTEESKNG